jgi:hypothetical protein
LTLELLSLAALSLLEQAEAPSASTAARAIEPVTRAVVRGLCFMSCS